MTGDPRMAAERLAVFSPVASDFSLHGTNLDHLYAEDGGTEPKLATATVDDQTLNPAPRSMDVRSGLGCWMMLVTP